MGSVIALPIVGLLIYAEDVKGLKWCWPTQMEELTVKKFLSIFFFIFLSALAFGELSIQEKIEGRNRPSIFSPWSDWFVNTPDMSYEEMTAAHNLLFARAFGLRFQRTGTDVQFAW